MPQPVTRSPLPYEIVSFNGSTLSATEWSLAIPANPSRRGFSIKNTGSTSMLVGVDDGFGNITQMADLDTRERLEMTENIYTGSIMVQPSSGSPRTYVAKEYI